MRNLMGLNFIIFHYVSMMHINHIKLNINDTFISSLNCAQLLGYKPI